jgi:hypothetical protein
LRRHAKPVWPFSQAAAPHTHCTRRLLPGTQILGRWEDTKLRLTSHCSSASIIVAYTIVLFHIRLRRPLPGTPIRPLPGTQILAVGGHKSSPHHTSHCSVASIIVVAYSIVLFHSSADICIYMPLIFERPQSSTAKRSRVAVSLLGFFFGPESEQRRRRRQRRRRKRLAAATTRLLLYGNGPSCCCPKYASLCGPSSQNFLCSRNIFYPRAAMCSFC